MVRIIVTNHSGAEIDFSAAVELMDAETREAVHMELGPCAEQAFFTAYEAAHAAKFSEWELSKADATY